MSSLSLRRILIVLVILDVATILGLQVSGLSWNPESGMMLLSTLYAFTPLLVIITLASFIFGTPAKNKKKGLLSNKKYQKALASCTILISLLGLLSAKISSNIQVFDYEHNKFAYQNTATGLLFGSFVFGLILIQSQNFVYWPLWSRADRKASDERQVMVRQRVFEKSYRSMIGVLVLSAFLYDSGEHYLVNFIIVWTIFMLATVPALIATWQKDS